MQRNMKKILAVLLAMAMIIPSVYLGESDKQEVKAASTEVSTDMLEVKLQVAEDRADVIRFISTVDSLDYNSVGFELEIPGQAQPITHEVKTVYERIVSSVTNEEYAFSPKLIDSTSEYFFTAMYAATSGVEYTVRAFVTTLDAPTVKVYGPSRSVSLGDNASDTINMMVDFATTENATYDVYSGETKVGSAKVIADKNVRITLESGYSATSFKSATVFTFKSGETNVGTTVYRNYYTKYTGTNTEDTSWYDVNTTAKEFVIASSADLYGFAKLVNNNTDLFAGDTIIQVRNIEVNKGTAGASAWSPDASATTTYEWDRIGKSGQAFSGTYDGDNNTISGLVDTTSTDSSGLFGCTNYGSLISNLKVANSNFKFVVANSGTVVGLSSGSLQGIYIGDDVYINSSVDNIGGIVGKQLITVTTQNNSIENCWFAGTIKQTAGYVGGIIGVASRGKVTIENCLFTGTIDGTGRVGGFVGTGESSATADSGTTAHLGRVTVKDCISAGTLKSTDGYSCGGVLGQTGISVTTIQNVYSNENRVHTGTSTGFNNSLGATGIGVLSNNAAAPVYGVPQVFTNTTDGTLYGTNAYLNTEFDFWSEDNEEGVWLAIADSTPVLRIGADVNSAIGTFSGRRSSMGWYYNAQTKKTATTQAMSLPEAATFEIDSVADLNGLADKVSEDQFNKDTIKLTADLDLSPGWTPSVDENGMLTNVPANQFTPIGNASKQFAGTFTGLDGDVIHSIHGVYVNDNAGLVGLFGVVAQIGTVENLKIENSYIASTGNNVGAVAGRLFGNAKSVYVGTDVYVKAVSSVGGIAGNFTGDNVSEISNCWVAGKIHHSGTQGGGIAGLVNTSTVSEYKTISNCLFSGTFTHTTPRLSDPNNEKIGGLVGWAYYTTLKLQNCLVTGQFKDAANYRCVGSAVGWGSNYVNGPTNVYATSEWKCLALPGVNGTLKTTEQLTGTAAFANMTGFPLRQAATGTEAWVATEAGPQLAIFATATPCYNQ